MSSEVEINPFPERVLRVDKRQVYGATKFYPMNKTAELFAEIAGSKTLSQRALETAKLLGYKVVRANPEDNSIFD